MFYFHDWVESSKLNVSMKKQAAQLKVSKDCHNKFLKNANIIANKIIQTMNDMNSIFKNDFRQLRQTASFTKGTQLDLPGDLNFHLLFKFPFQVKIVKNRDISPRYPTHEFLKASAKHPIVKGGFIHLETFQSLLQNDIKNAINSIKSVDCKGKLYKLSYTFIAELAAHSIVATEQKTNDENIACISFDFVPAIDLCEDYMCPCVISMRHDCHRYSREITALLQYAGCESKHNIVVVLRLLRHILVANGESSQSTSLILKDVYFSKLLNQGIGFVACPFGAQIYNFFCPDIGSSNLLSNVILQTFSMTGVIRPTLGPLNYNFGISGPRDFKLKLLRCKFDHENCDKLVDEIFAVPLC